MDNFKTQYIELFKKVLMGILYEQSNWQQIHSQPVKNFFSLQFFKNLMIKISNVKDILEIGTFTGLSTLSMSLALPDDGSILTLDKNLETNKIAQDFFNKANQNEKIKTIIKE